jgi:hypothetical protein
MENNLAIKKIETISFAGTCMEVEIIMLSEKGQSHKDKYHMFSLICGNWDGGEVEDLHIVSLTPGEMHQFKVGLH